MQHNSFEINEIYCSTVELLTLELTARFPTFHLMDVMGICYPQYCFQGDVKDNFYYHMELIKSHYCIESHLEPINSFCECFRYPRLL